MTSPVRPTILPSTTTVDIVAQVQASLGSGLAVRLGRWLVAPDGASYELCFCDDTPACRAGGAPETGWWTETCFATAESAATDFVATWMAD